MIKLSKEELRMILVWGNAVHFEYGLNEDEEILLDKIFKELEEKEVL